MMKLQQWQKQFIKKLIDIKDNKKQFYFPTRGKSTIKKTNVESAKICGNNISIIIFDEMS